MNVNYERERIRKEEVVTYFDIYHGINLGRVGKADALPTPDRTTLNPNECVIIRMRLQCSLAVRPPIYMVKLKVIANYGSMNNNNNNVIIALLLQLLINYTEEVFCISTVLYSYSGDGRFQKNLTRVLRFSSFLPSKRLFSSKYFLFIAHQSIVLFDVI
jgi:hypothetical protein